MYSEQWSAISARIAGVSEAATLHARYLSVHNKDSHGMYRELGRECAKIFTEIRAFARDYTSVLPEPVLERLKQLESERGHLFSVADQSDNSIGCVVLLSAIRSELNYLLTNHQEFVRSRAERAFHHLQRLLIANEKEREIWRIAHEKGETACEKLGAVHLLWHGIYAFKVDAAGGRSDLLMPEPLDERAVARTSDGLVLTEWKSVTENDAPAKFNQARRQCGLYRSGILAGVELTRYRFLVAVSMDALPPSAIPPDDEENGVVYRHINIAVAPQSPSKLAKGAH